MPPARKQTTAERLAATRSDLAEAEGKARQLIAARREALVADDTAKAARLDAQIDEQRRLARAHADKLRLIEGEIAEEKRQQREAEQAAQRAGVVKLLDRRLESGRQFAAAYQQCVAAWRDMVATSLEAHESWGWPLDSGAAALDQISLTRFVQAEMWRVGGIPPWTGSPMPPRGYPPSFPGARAPHLMSVGQPESLPKLVDEIEQANKSAAAIMGGARVVATTGAPASRLGALLTEMDALSRDQSEAGEKRYAEVVAEIAALSEPEAAHG